jgi:hypothetical protein
VEVAFICVEPPVWVETELAGRMGEPVIDGRILERARGTAVFGWMLVGISIVCLGFPVICCTPGIAVGAARVAVRTKLCYITVHNSQKYLYNDCAYPFITDHTS